MELLAAGKPVEAARAFRAAIAADDHYYEAHHGLVRALRDAGQLENAIGAALALTALTPNDPLAHTALSISLQTAGHIAGGRGGRGEGAHCGVEDSVAIAFR